MKDEDLEKFLTELRKGVQFERHGDMEADIYSADEFMKEAADIIEVLLNEKRKKHAS